MKIHHLNCGSMCPYAGFLLNDDGRFLEHGHIVSHCLLVETNNGLVLIDTGIGLHDTLHPEKLSFYSRHILKPKLDQNETAIRQIESLGFKSSDVRHIIVTHLDFDHAGGIPDFPDAAVHVFADELSAALNPSTYIESNRYSESYFQNHPHWHPYSVQGEKWFGFEAVRDLKGLPPEILMVPLTGHTRGHCGVAIDTTEGWYLHAGDSYFYHGEMNPLQPHSTPIAGIYQTLVQTNGSMRIQNQEKLRSLIKRRPDDLQVFCSHDPKEFQQMKRLTDLKFNRTL